MRTSKLWQRIRKISQTSVIGVNVALAACGSQPMQVRCDGRLERINVVADGGAQQRINSGSAKEKPR